MASAIIFVLVAHITGAVSHCGPGQPPGWCSNTSCATADTSSMDRPAHCGGVVGAPVSWTAPGWYWSRMARRHAAVRAFVASAVSGMGACHDRVPTEPGAVQ